jgi:hypothetical protein
MDLDLSIGQSVLIALGLAVVLALLHLLSPYVRKLPGVPESAMASFAGGLAVAYVFLHLLPEIAAGNEAIGEALSDVVEPTPLFELAIFLVALTGFAVFYGLEHAARRSRSSTGGEPTPAVYWLHLGSFTVYNVLITYTMALRVRTGLLFALLFSVAMGLHFVLIDRSLREHYPRRFSHSGRLVLAGALLLGWALGALFAPTSTLVVSILTAALGGSILLNVFKEELPSDRRSSFGWFLTGLVLYAALLAAVTALAE